MPSYNMVTIVSPETDDDMVKYITAPTLNRHQAGQKFMQYWRALMGGSRSAKVIVGGKAVRASGTITLASHVATDTVTVNGVTSTCVASGATGNQYNVGGSDTITATNLAAAINASVTALVSGYLSASSSAAVVTITAAKPGLAANMFTLAISAHGSVSGAKLTGGTDGATERTHFYGSGF